MRINAKKYLEKSCGKLSLGQVIRAIRLGEEESQTAFAKKLKISTQYLCDLEHNRKLISPKKAQTFATTLGHSPETFVALAIQDTLNQEGIKMLVDIRAA